MMTNRVLTENSMQGGHQKVSYWIQRADYSSTSDSEPISLAGAQSLLRGHDWRAELDHQDALEAAEKDSCPPGIGFVVAAGPLLHIVPSRDGTAQCFFLDEDKGLTWDRDHVSLAEQGGILELLYRGDYSGLIRGWNEAQIRTEEDTSRRDEWLALTKEIRTRRGQPPDLTDEERNLSENDAYTLYRREAELEHGERQQEEATRGAHSARKWFLIIATGGALLASLLYSDVMQAILPERFLEELWAWSTMAIAAGLLVGGLRHLELRAVRLGTPSARRLSHAANVLVGTVMGVAGVITVAFFFVLAGTLMLGFGGGFTEKHFFIAVGAVIGIMGTVALLTAYVGFRSNRDGSGYETALDVAGLSLAPFLWVGLGVNFLALVVLISAASVHASGIDGTLSLSLKIATGATASAMALVSWLRRKKNSVGAQQGLATALLALALLAAVQIMQTFGAPKERPHNGPTAITKALALPRVALLA
jgi:hypothetical protein